MGPVHVEFQISHQISHRLSSKVIPLLHQIFLAALVFDCYGFMYFFLSIFSLFFFKREKGQRRVDGFVQVRDLECWDFFFAW